MLLKKVSRLRILSLPLKLIVAQSSQHGGLCSLRTPVNYNTVTPPVRCAGQPVLHPASIRLVHYAVSRYVPQPPETLAGRLWALKAHWWWRIRPHQIASLMWPLQRTRHCFWRRLGCTRWRLHAIIDTRGFRVPWNIKRCLKMCGSAECPEGRHCERLHACMFRPGVCAHLQVQSK